MTGFIFLRRCPRFSIFPCAILQPSLDKGDRTITANQLALLHLGIRADGKIIAFSYGSPVSGRVFDVHVEKALYDVNGAYNIINREFARRFCGDYQWINREDDVSEEGLRKAKLSYNPAFLQEKFCADLLGGETGCFG